MRYTTIIDITEYPALYRSHAVRMVYLHLVLRSGYHDHDRDLCGVSIRRLAADTGLTLSAVRCALSRLQAAQLIRKEGTVWMVRKFVIEQPITKRATTAKRLKQQEVDAETHRIQEQQQRQRDLIAERRARERQQGKTSYMIYYEEQQRKAAAGDPEAAEYCRRNLDTYNDHLNSINHGK